MKFPCRLLSGARVSVAIAALCCGLLVSTAMAKTDDLGVIEALINKGQFAQALTQLEPILRQQPKHMSGRFLRARALFAAGKQRPAQRLLQELLREQSKWPEIHNNLAVIYASQGDFDKAKKQLELALATHPGYQTAYDNLVVVYERLASQAYRQALSPDESLVLPDIRLAMIGHLPLPKPTPEPVRTSPAKADKQPVMAGLGQDNTPIKAMIKAWAKAWSQQQPERYLGYYDDNFKPAAGLSRKDWAARRRLRLRAPQYIRVRVDKIDITAVDERVVSVFLRQHYESDRLNDIVTKNLIIRKHGGKWRIFQENLVR